MIYEKLHNIQQELSAPKNQWNDFGNYHYRNCEDILEALKPLLKTNKAVVLFTDSIEVENGRNYIKTNLKFVDIETGESIDSYALAREEETKRGMDGSQITGASSSYARKYALNGMFLIDDNKDSDTTNTHGKEESKTQPSSAPKTNDLKKEKQKPASETKPKANEKSSVKFICAKCKKEIKPYYSEKLKRDVGLREHEELSNKNFGTLLCLDCMKEVKSAFDKANANKESNAQ